MNLSWRDRLTEYIREQAHPLEKFSHQPRLYTLTQLVGEGVSYDDDVVFAAVWLHDLGVFSGHRPNDLEQLMRWDNTAYAMQQTPFLLERFDFPPQKIPAVVEAIRTHQPANNPTTVEAEILRDADILEQLGAVAVMRTTCKIGRDTRFHTFSHAADSLRSAAGTLPGLLRLPRAKQLAQPRIATLHHFLASLEQEAGAYLD